ncbi:GNAT family N-acetyltransferase [Bacillus sp. BRMEA1]|uniref:GNAT family N-acetyltransferase n=1 Tax=Neobacillus endophyticus TaxID=2738405 RepID=UPI00156668BF|nr:GNAT family N-acetyltransferase [Neobacillus endophyticus]NRD79730.1 GNAT family N-acetyltransferase [Neobacillus endophyticus]
MTIFTEIKAVAENVRSNDSQQLIKQLSDELANIYEVTDGSAGFVPEDVEVPRAAFVVARIAGCPAGCGAIRPLNEHTVEVKRMYTVPKYRRKGVAQAILAELERLAGHFGYREIVLQTGPRQPEAIALYERVGYKHIPIFSGDWEEVSAFQKDLTKTQA